ncbi:McrB family protein [Segatella copri]|uniref:McrB family protein n=1 Tax=Segatella copri TaxID=165179 RepID=UPI003F891599
MKNIKSYIELLKANKNLVLTGAPGTGKTYLARQIARAMRAKVEFVQFHPSYSYTDFVEGLRPCRDGAGQIGFKRQDGVFKAFCKDAIATQKAFEIHEDNSKTHEDAPKDLSYYYNVLVDKIVNKEITNIEKKNSKKMGVYCKNGKTIYNTYGQSISDKTLNELSKTYPDCESLKSSNFKTSRKRAYAAVLYMLYKMKEEDELNEAELKADQEVQEDNQEYIDVLSEKEPKPYVFIIDEINRGELSKIFGELFYAIDPGYRGRKGKVKTQYQNLVGKTDVFANGFYVPENVYIIATMNDIDRSIESIDFALRRRFAWKVIKPEDRTDMLLEKLDPDTCTRALNVMTALNKEISSMRGLGSAYQIGPAYFIKLDKDHYNGDFTALWNMHIEVLLKEYLRVFNNADIRLEQFKEIYFDSLIEK